MVNIFVQEILWSKDCNSIYVTSIHLLYWRTYQRHHQDLLFISFKWSSTGCHLSVNSTLLSLPICFVHHHVGCSCSPPPIISYLSRYFVRTWSKRHIFLFVLLARRKPRSDKNYRVINVLTTMYVLTSILVQILICHWIMPTLVNEYVSWTRNLQVDI